jgi:hypothetical protein
VLRSNEKLPQSTGSVREEELAKEVKRWMRKYNELTDLSDDVTERERSYVYLCICTDQ